MNYYMDRPGSYSGSGSGIGTNRLLGKSFLWMFIGMIVSGGAAWFTYSSGVWVPIFASGMFNVLLIAELVAVILFTFLFRRLPAAMVTFLYLLYALINGVTLSCAFVVYELGSIVLLFGVAALAFGALGLIGYNSKKDMTGWGIYLFVSLQKRFHPASHKRRRSYPVLCHHHLRCEQAQEHSELRLLRREQSSHILRHAALP